MRLFIYIADDDCEDNLPSKHGCTLGGLWDCKDWAQYGYCDWDWLAVNWACVTTPPGMVKDHCKRSCNMCSKLLIPCIPRNVRINILKWAIVVE